MKTISVRQYQTQRTRATKLLLTVAAWFVRVRQRQALRELDRRLLDDIGVSEEERDRELAKPFWR